MLIDEVEITVKGGHGGPGKVSFGPGKFSGPDGGNGGRGGDVFIKVTSDLTALNQFTRKTFLKADDGEAGAYQKKSGEDGEDLELTLPIGTELTDKDTGEILELNDLNQKILAAKGGLGGKGNFELKSPKVTTPKFAQKGLPGKERSLKVLLKLIADFGLIGLPNAGKSSLLNELTAANVKVGSYPFTTLEPNLGVLGSPLAPSGRSGRGQVLADIPGLIEGASGGKGLGIKFLKHIEKVKLLLHCISVESEDVVKDYQVVRNEMGSFNPELLDKEEIILLAKSDLVEKKELEKGMKALKKFKRQILPVSVYDFNSLENLKKELIIRRLLY